MNDLVIYLNIFSVVVGVLFYYLFKFVLTNLHSYCLPLDWFYKFLVWYKAPTLYIKVQQSNKQNDCGHWNDDVGDDYTPMSAQQEQSLGSHTAWVLGHQHQLIQVTFLTYCLFPPATTSDGATVPLLLGNPSKKQTCGIGELIQLCGSPSVMGQRLLDSALALMSSSRDASHKSKEQQVVCCGQMFTCCGSAV